MSGSTLGIVEMTLSGVLALGFCVYQYFKMDREIKKDKAEAARKATQKSDDQP
ncbi:hypothetical protein ACR9YC_04975 [Parasphingorhabdus sp. DH2-15]|uniref:hypothetical protein n=1 Tax=Parasphingorhabdus sp. DH2-15 TaxID=3444112 RepID=UPI003F68559D